MDGTFQFSKPLVVYHAAPLHYLPEIIECGELRSQKLVGWERARRTARRRDRMLGLDEFVHCSLTEDTPLLRHKLALGYSHVVLELVLDSSLTREIAVLPMNTKAWRSRWQCRPVFDRHDIDRLIRLSSETKRFGSLEVLARDTLPLSCLRSITVFHEDEYKIVSSIVDHQPLKPAVDLKSRLAPADYTPRYLEQIDNFVETRRTTGTVVAPPKLPFD